jgi:hypothetical protein
MENGRRYREVPKMSCTGNEVSAQGTARIFKMEPKASKTSQPGSPPSSHHLDWLRPKLEKMTAPVISSH